MEKGIKRLLHNMRRREEKAFCLQATSYKGAQANGTTLIFDFDMEKIYIASRGRRTVSDGTDTAQRIEPCPVEGKTNCLTTVAKDNTILQRGRGLNKGKVYEDKSPTVTSSSWQENNLLMKQTRQLNPSKESKGTQPYQQDRIYDISHKSPALCATLTGGACKIGDEMMESCRIRRLTPTECARLQTVPEWYKWKCSKTQQYKMLGNGWTVEVIKHILSFMPSEMTID